MFGIGIWRGSATMVLVLIVGMALPATASADPDPTATSSPGISTPSPTASDTMSGTPSSSPTETLSPPPPGSSPAPSSATPTEICSPTPPAQVTVSPSAPNGAGISRCGTVPAPGELPPGSEQSVEDVNESFPGAPADSADIATEDLAKAVPESHVRTRQLVQQKSDLPVSIGEETWKLPETDEAVSLDLTQEGNLETSREVGPGFREYDGGEKGTRTILQQLPGRTIRIYKVIDRHETGPGAPTEFRFTFNKDCTEKKCATDWRLSDKYSYLGHNGVTLIDPNEQSDVIAEGKPVGFFTEPVARDTNSAPVYVDWRLDGDTVHIGVHDYTDGIRVSSGR